jgi:hypothetical protein
VARTKVVSWLRAAGLTFPTAQRSVVFESALVPVTVAGPHRLCTGFRGSRPRSIMVAKLSTSQRLRKRDNHRASDYQRYGEQISRIYSTRRRRCRQIDSRKRILWHVGGEKATVVALID